MGGGEEAIVDDGALMILLLLAAPLLLLLLVLAPRAKEGRAERERQAAAERAQRQRREAEDRARGYAERARLRGERKALLKSIRSGAQDFILKARLEFECGYRSSGGEGMFGHEMSPLLCFSYRVGKTNARIETCGKISGRSTGSTRQALKPSAFSRRPTND